MKKMITAIISFALALAMMVPSLPAYAADILPKKGSSLIEDVDYEGKGKVDVEFAGKVAYGKVSVVVKDTDGKSYKATVVKKDNDDLTFRIDNPKTGKDYRFTIKNMKKKGAAKLRSVTGYFRIAGPKECLVDDIDYDAEDKEVSFDFQGKVTFRNPSVQIKDSNGNNIGLNMSEFDADGIEVLLNSKLKKGVTYSYIITGVSRKGKNSYKTVKGKFKI